MFCSAKRALCHLMQVAICVALVTAEGWQAAPLPKQRHYRNPSQLSERQQSNVLDRESVDKNSNDNNDNNNNGVWNLNPAPTSRPPSPYNTGFNRPTRGGSIRFRASKSSASTSSSRLNASTLLSPFRNDQAATRSRANTITTTTTTTINEGERLSWMVGFAYFCTAIAVNLPIVLMPTIAAEQVSMLATLTPAAFTASVASILTLGGGIGKLVNGPVCQVVGGRRSMMVYMSGIGLVSLLLSANTVTSRFGWILAIMEFLWSIQWTACSVVLANYFEKQREQLPNNDETAIKENDKQFAAAITKLGLMSTAGTIIAKVGGTVLLPVLGSWQAVTQLASLAAFLGAAVACFGIPAATKQDTAVQQQTVAPKRPETVMSNLVAAPRRLMEQVTGGNKITKRPEAASSEKTTLLESFQQVLSSPLFWMIGLAHAASFLGRTSDRVLGSFYVAISGLPRSLCGGLTTSCTLGFVYGLTRGLSFSQMDTQEKKAFLRQNYATAAVAAVGLALVSGPYMVDLVPWPIVRAAIVFVLSGVMTSSLSFQFYQIPNLVGIAEFGPQKAIFLSLMDGLGYFCSTTVWAATGQLVSSGGGGWASAWLLLGALFAGGGGLMLRALDGLWSKEKER